MIIAVKISAILNIFQIGPLIMYLPNDDDYVINTRLEIFKD